MRSAPAATWSCRATSTIPEATAAAIDRDGWLHTGDLGSMDQRGYCRIEGRIKEMIIRGGENIYPREIETVLLSHPAVTEAAVVGSRRPVLGRGRRRRHPHIGRNAAHRGRTQRILPRPLPPTRSQPAGHSPAPFPSPPQERSAKTCSARNSPTRPDPPGLPRSAVTGSGADAPPPVQLTDLELTFSLGSAAGQRRSRGGHRQRRLPADGRGRGEWKASRGTRPTDGVEHFRQSRPRPGDRRADPGNRHAGGEECPARPCRHGCKRRAASAITS